MNAITRTTLALATTMLLASAARAEQFWVAYEGDVLPEDAGWTRYHGYDDSEAVRWIEDGALVIDSRADTQMYDCFTYDPPASLIPNAGEMFVAQWRLLVEETFDYGYGHADVSVGIKAAGAAIKIAPSTDNVFYTEGDLGRSATSPIAPGQWHGYELRTTNMVTYDLFIDDAFVATANVGEYFLEPMEFAFGDTIIGASSLTRWDYVRFGVVPEPGAAVLFVAGATTLYRRR